MKKKYLAPLMSLLATGGLLTVALVLLFGHSFAWFSSVREPRASGMHLSVRGVPETEQYLTVGGVRVDGAAEDLFSGLTPGDTVRFSLVIVNKSGRPIVADVFLAPPTEAEDPPYEQDGKYHYFGTQLRVNSVKAGDDALLPLTGAERYLLTLSEELYHGDAAAPLPPTALSSPYEFSGLPHKTLASNVAIAAGGTLTLDVEIEFVDNGLLQNPYIGHGDSASSDPAKAALTFSRTLACSYEYQ